MDIFWGIITIIGLLASSIGVYLSWKTVINTDIIQKSVDQAVRREQKINTQVLANVKLSKLLMNFLD